MIGRVRAAAGAVWHWIDDRGGVSHALRPILKHPVPPQLAGRAGWFYVLGASILAVFALQVVTGIALATIYVPSTANAYDSLHFISRPGTWGAVLRGMHYIGASFMVALVALHMGRVLITGSFKFPRELNWLTGVLLFVLTMLMAFTGQLLRWDQDAIGSVLVAAEQIGRVPIIGHPLARFTLAGETIGGATLSRFFAYHVFVFSGAIIAVLSVHLYLVIHNGISEPPRAGEPVDRRTYRARYRALLDRAGRPYFPDAVWKEAVVAAIVIAVILVLAIVVGARPLGSPPDPSAVDVEPRPDWYLLWIYAVLAKTPKVLEDWVIVLGPPLVIGLLIAIPFVFNGGERHPLRRPWVPAIVGVIAIGVVSFWYIGRTAPWSPRFDVQPFTPAEVGASSGPVWDGAQAIYDRGCLYCHSVDGRGGIRGPDLTHVLARLTEADVRARILTGPPGMPSYADILTPPEMDALIAYLRSLDEPKAK